MQINQIIRLWFLGILLFAANNLRAAEGDEVLLVVYQDGYNVREAYFSFENNPVVTFDGDVVLVTSTQAQATYQIDDVIEMTFVPEDPVVTHVEDEISGADASAKILFRILSDNLIQVVGTHLNPAVSVYTVDGKSVDVPVDYSEREINIRLGALPRGLYIIKTNQQTFKFIRK